MSLHAPERSLLRAGLGEVDVYGSIREAKRPAQVTPEVQRSGGGVGGEMRCWELRFLLLTALNSPPGAEARV